MGRRARRPPPPPTRPFIRVPIKAAGGGVAERGWRLQKQLHHAESLCALLPPVSLHRQLNQRHLAHCLPMPVDKYPIHQLTHLGTTATSYCEPDRFVHRTYANPHARHSRPIYKLCWRRRRCACQEQHREHGPRSSARSLGGEGAIIVKLQTNEPDFLDPQGAHEKGRSIASKGDVPNTQHVWNDELCHNYAAIRPYHVTDTVPTLVGDRQPPSLRDQHQRRLEPIEADVSVR